MVKNVKKMRKNEKSKGRGQKKAEDFFFFLLFTFGKPLKLLMGLPKWKFHWEKAKITS